MFIKISDFSRVTVLKWLINLCIAALVYWLLPVSDTLTLPMVAFMAVTAWAVSAWALNTMNEIAVGIVLPVLYMVFCGLGKNVVYSPWLSEVPIIVIGGFILGKIIQDTGLGKRIAVACVGVMGGSFNGALVGLTLGAMALSPLVPSIMGKAAILCAVSISLCDALGFKPKSREATAVMMATCLAVGSTKLCYLTGAADMVLGMGLADAVLGTNTTWVEYAIHNVVPATLYAIMSLGIVMVVLRSPLQKSSLVAIVQAQYAELKTVSDDQKRAMALLLLTLVLLSTDSLHGFSAGVVLVGIAILAFVPGISLMDGARLNSVNWGPLFYLMGCMAIGSAGSSLKVTDWMAHLVLPFFTGMGVTTAGVCAYVTGIVANFILMPLASVTTLTAPITALGVQMGMEPRILYYSFVYGLDNVLLPYEYALYLYFFSTGYISFKGMFMVMAVRMVVTAAFIAFVAVPYWKLVI